MVSRAWPGSMKLGDFDPRMAKTVEEAQRRYDPEQMRLRLQEYAHHNPLTKMVFDSARYAEMQGRATSTLDLMTTLAFFALADREHLEAAALDMLSMRPMAPMLACKDCPHRAPLCVTNPLEMTVMERAKEALQRGDDAAPASSGMTEAESAFLRELAELTAKHGVKVDGCGCCGSPFLSSAPTEPGRYDYSDSWGQISWRPGAS